MAHLVNAANHIPALPGALLTGEDGPLFMTREQITHEIRKAAAERRRLGELIQALRYRYVVDSVDEILDRLTAGRD